MVEHQVWNMKEKYKVYLVSPINSYVKFLPQDLKMEAKTGLERWDSTPNDQCPYLKQDCDSQVFNDPGRRYLAAG